jgi:hypothetical protein
MRQMFRAPRNVWQLEQGVISMLAGDLFDSPEVLRRLRLFRVIYGIRNLLQWRTASVAHNHRMAQARSQFSGGTTPLDRL